MSEGFTSTRLEEEREKDKHETFTVWINEEDREMLNKAKKQLQQSKDSTAFKTLAWIGAKTLGDEKTSYILEQVMSNKRKNKRLNTVEFD